MSEELRKRGINLTIKRPEFPSTPETITFGASTIALPTYPNDLFDPFASTLADFVDKSIFPEDSAPDQEEAPDP